MRNRRIGFVFQQFNLLASMPAWRNVELPLDLRRGRAGRTAATAPSRHWAGSAWPTGSSTGRASFPAGSSSGSPSPGRWSTEPALLLADEPTGNLDSASTAEILDLFGSCTAAAAPSC